MKRKTNVKTKFRKCPTSKKSMFRTEKEAGRVMMRIWSHDSSADIHDLHTYICPDCGSWHVGHRSYYEMAQKSVATNSQSVSV